MSLASMSLTNHSKEGEVHPQLCSHAVVQYISRTNQLSGLVLHPYLLTGSSAGKDVPSGGSPGYWLALSSGVDDVWLAGWLVGLSVARDVRITLYYCCYLEADVLHFVLGIPTPRDIDILLLRYVP
jgi:hypothetical protein